MKGKPEGQLESFVHPFFGPRMQYHHQPGMGACLGGVSAALLRAHEDFQWLQQYDVFSCL